jgi:ribonuclease Z
MRSQDVKLTKVSAIMITHLHGDHCFGLFGLLSTLALHGRSAPLVLVGPVGIKEMVSTVLRLSGGARPACCPCTCLGALRVGARGD